MATINGARALGMAEQIGSLEVGKAADLIAIDVSAPEYQPLYDPRAQIIHTTAGDAVTHVWVAGQCLLEERRLNTLNLAEILPAVETWSRRIRP